MTLFEFLIPKRPLSLQAKRKSLQAWKGFVHAEAAKVWSGPIFEEGNLQLTLIYLCDQAPPDIDNIIKPIQDALVGLVFIDDSLIDDSLIDDSLIGDVDSHRRFLNETFDLTRLPTPLLLGIASQQECVYVRVSSSKSLEDYL